MGYQICLPFPLLFVFEQSSRSYSRNLNGSVAFHLYVLVQTTKCALFDILSFLYDSILNSLVRCGPVRIHYFFTFWCSALSTPLILLLCFIYRIFLSGIYFALFLRFSYPLVFSFPVSISFPTTMVVSPGDFLYKSLRSLREFSQCSHPFAVERVLNR